MDGSKTKHRRRISDYFINFVQFHKIREEKLAIFVFLTAFFCVYTGGHYPLDTAAGFVLGVIAGRSAVYIKRLYLKRSGYEN